MTRQKFMNIEVDNLTFSQALDSIEGLVERQGHDYVVTPNVDHIVRLEHDAELRQIYKNASLILTDGKPLIWISRIYNEPIVEKISGSDLFPALCDRAAQRGWTMFFFGAAPGVAAKAAENLQNRYPGLRVVGTSSPDYGFEEEPEKLAAAIDEINLLSPDILIVGLGCPKQEKFIFRNRSKLKVKLSLGLGASLDFEAGYVKRAPKWMQRHGLEWLYRITQDPGRLAKRYLVDDIRIVPLAFKYRGQWDAKNNE